MTADSQPAIDTAATDAAMTTAKQHHQAGRLQQAVAIYRTILAASPGHAEANHFLGLAAYQTGNNEIAVDLIGRAISVDPGKAFYHQNLGCALKAMGRLDQAVSAFQRALALRPDYADASYNLGNALQEQGDFTQAEAAYRRALDVEPESAATHNNLGGVLQQLCRFDESAAAFRRALELGSDDADTRYNLAFSLLASGRLEEGWREHEHRLRRTAARPPVMPAQTWDGGPLDGKTILVTAEQGIGDEILFASCLPDLIARAGHCVIECEPRLGSLFARSFPTATVYGRARDDVAWLAEAPPIDVQISLASLMRHLRPSVASFPDHRGYLRPDPAVRDGFARRLAAMGSGLKVGISWRSMRNSPWQASFTTLDEWRGILTLPGVRFVNLQYDGAAPEVADANRLPGVEIHDFPDLDLLNDIDGVAALISELDLVIAPGNTVHAIAGGLGVPLWLLDLATNWSSLGCDTYPWFPSATVYRLGPEATSWSAVFRGVETDLAK